MTASYPPGRFGALEIEEGRITHFLEKPKGDGGMINSDFFVLSPGVLDYIDGEDTTWEQEPLRQLAGRRN